MNQQIKKMDLKSLCNLRDELKLKTHLFDMETRQRWEMLEKDWQLIRFEIEELMPLGARTATEIKLDSLPLFEKIENSLIQIREGVNRHHSGAL